MSPIQYQMNKIVLPAGAEAAYIPSGHFMKKEGRRADRFRSGVEPALGSAKAPHAIKSAKSIYEGFTSLETNSNQLNNTRLDGTTQAFRVHLVRSILYFLSRTVDPGIGRLTDHFSF